MKMILKNTSSGLIPMYDDDYEEKRKLKIGEVYSVEIKKARNYELLKKYFALIKCSWEYLTEAQSKHFGIIDNFRKTCEVAAGYCEKVYSIERREWVESPKSISFEKMDEFEFRELYEGVRCVIFEVFLRHVSFEVFDEKLRDF